MAQSSQPPSTPQKAVNPLYTNAQPLTPRSSHISELKARSLLQSSTTVTISAFTSLITSLTISLSSSALPSQRTRLDRIEQFREDFLCGAFDWEKPPELVEDAFSDGTRLSIGDISSAHTESEIGNDGLPVSPLEKGILAEKTIKAELRRLGVLLNHSNFKSLGAAARKAMTRALALGKPVYLSCGLLKSPNFVKEYEEKNWAPPGIRWGNFKPDLIRFEKKGTSGEVTWEIVEIKYSGSGREIVYANYKIQAIFYHLCLVKLLSAVPLLSPSHKVSIWLSRDPLTPAYIEKPLALRTNLAYVEHHLFLLLPQWLHATTAKEWKAAQDIRIDSARNTPTATPTRTFLEKLQAGVISTPPPPPSKSGRTSPLRKELLKQVPSLTLLERLQGFGASSTTCFPPISSLPPLPDEVDDDLAELFGGLTAGS